MEATISHEKREGVPFVNHHLKYMYLDKINTSIGSTGRHLNIAACTTIRLSDSTIVGTIHFVEFLSRVTRQVQRVTATTSKTKPNQELNGY